MAYSTVGIINLALQRIGVGKITALYPDENSTAAIDAAAIWEYIRDEVLQAKEWNFAKTRVALARKTIDPAFGFSYAYALPTDFLRICTDNKNDRSVSYGTGTTYAYPAGEYAGYAVETLSDSTLCLLTNYDNSTGYDIYIKYIKRIEDPGKFSPSFINALSFRLAAELAIPRTEGLKKYEMMITLYQKALIAADGVNQSGDYVQDIGSTDWELAGR